MELQDELRQTLRSNTDVRALLTQYLDHTRTIRLHHGRITGGKDVRFGPLSRIDPTLALLRSNRVVAARELPVYWERLNDLGVSITSRADAERHLRELGRPPRPPGSTPGLKGP